MTGDDTRDKEEEQEEPLCCVASAEDTFDDVDEEDDFMVYQKLNFFKTMTKNKDKKVENFTQFQFTINFQSNSQKTAKMKGCSKNNKSIEILKCNK